MIESNMTREEIEKLLFNVIKKHNDKLSLEQIYQEEGIRTI